MTMNIRLFLVLIAFMGVQLSLIEAHSNTVAVAGTEVTIKCENTISGNCDDVEWKKQIATAVTIYRSNVYSAFRDRYSVNGSSGCNLHIKNVSLTDAGRFLCVYINQERNSVIEASLLIVLESVPRCSVQVNASSEGIAAEGDRIQFSCEVRFNATEGGGASMTWKNIVNVSASVKPNTDGRLLHSVVAKRPEIPSLECNTTFDIPKNITGLASNIPSAPPCMAEHNKRLLYPVSTVTLTPSSDYYSLGSEISCSADGRPSPSYQWQSSDNNQTWTDIFVESGKPFIPSTATKYNASFYRCVANNTIRDKSFVVYSQTFQINGKSGDSGQNPEDKTLIIIIIASAAAGVACLIVIVIICICKVRTKEAKNKQGNDKSSGGDQIPMKSTPAMNGSISPQMTTIPVSNKQPQPRTEAAKRPQIPAPEPKKPKGDSNKKTTDSPQQKEEVLYAALAMDQGPKRRVPQMQTNDPHAVYADVQLA